MSVLNAAIFGGVAALIVGGTDYAMAMKKHVGEDYSLLDHIEFRMGAVMTGSGVAKALPRAPVGWDVQDATPEDSLRIRGRSVNPAKLAEMAELDEKFAALPGYQTESRLYQKGAAEILLNISFAPANMKGTVLVKSLMQVDSMIYELAKDVPGQTESAVALRKLSGPEYGKVANYIAPTDGQIFISALSTATEADTLALLAGIDSGALQTLVTNDPTIGQAADVAAGGLPAKTAPEKAVACVQKGAAKFCSSTN